MTYLGEASLPEQPQKLALEDRSRLTMDGVRDVESFDENMIVLHTVRGTLVVRGQSLHLQMLSLDGGQVAVDGKMDSLIFEDEKRSGGFFSRFLG